MFVIDCATCPGRGTDACDGCVVDVVVSDRPGEPITVDGEELRALRLLAGAGLIPSVHRARRAG